MAVVEDSGYPLGWFKNQDIAKSLYECVICLDVVKDAVQVRDCGHLFCRYCIEKVLKLQAKCPTCRKDISEEMIFPDKNANRAIEKLEVNCPSTSCKWDGTLNSLLQEHNARCPFFVLNCNNVGCDMQGIRQELEVHLTECEHRTVVCEHCKSEYVFKDKDEHLSTCLFISVECENKCAEENIPRNEMKEHLDTVCSKTVTKCKYSEFGCEYKCERQEMEEHLNQAMKEHLELSSLEISQMKKKEQRKKDELKEKLEELKIKYKEAQLKEKHEKLERQHKDDELKEKIEKLERQVAGLKVIPTSPPIVIITDFNQKLSEAKKNNQLGRIYSDPFYTSPHGYKLKIGVSLNEIEGKFKGHMGVYIFVMKSDHDVILSWPFKKKYTFTLIDQQDNEKERKNIVRAATTAGQKCFERPKDKDNTGCGFLDFVSHETLFTRQYIKDDTVFITLSIPQ